MIWLGIAIGVVTGSVLTLTGITVYVVTKWDPF